MFGLLAIQLLMYAGYILALYVFTWWIAAFIELIDIFIVNFYCIYHIFYDLPLDLAQGIFLASPAPIKIFILAVLVFVLPGSTAVPFLGIILAIILLVHLVDYVLLTMDPKTHRKWCRIRRRCHYSYVAKRIKRVTLMFMTIPSKKPKPKKCKKRKSIEDEFKDIFPKLADFFGDLFFASENSNKYEDRFPYVSGLSEPESKAIIRAKWEKKENENQ